MSPHRDLAEPLADQEEEQEKEEEIYSNDSSS